MNFKSLKLFAFSVFIFFLASSNAFSQSKVAIFTINNSGVGTKALLNESTKSIYRVFNDLGRFMPIELKKVSAKVRENTGSKKSYHEIAKDLNAEIYVVVSVYSVGGKVQGELHVVSKNEKFKKMNKKFIVKSYLPLNVPDLFALKIASLHENVPIRPTVIEKKFKFFVIDVGQWHGISKGVYKLSKDENFEIKRVSRFSSLVLFKSDKPVGFNFIIRKYPEYKKSIELHTKRVKEKTTDAYMLDKKKLSGVDAEKQFLQTIVVINPIANLFLPGYAGYLSTGTLGFRNPKLDNTSLGITMGFYLSQLSIVPLMTGFDANFFPWIEDTDRSESVQRLHSYLWLTLPFTFTASYMDQLRRQLKKNRNLPPFFHNADTTSAMLSLLFSGTGHFYKGNQKAGWLYYTSQFTLGGAAFYYGADSKEGKILFSVFAVVKVVDIVHAWFSATGYKFYEKEMNETHRNIRYSFNVKTSIEGDPVVNFAIINKF